MVSRTITLKYRSSHWHLRGENTLEPGESFFLRSVLHLRRGVTIVRSLSAGDRWQNRLVWLCNRLGSRDATGREVLGQVSNLLAVTAAQDPSMDVYPDWFPSLRSSLVLFLPRPIFDINANRACASLSTVFHHARALLCRQQTRLDSFLREGVLRLSGYGIEYVPRLDRTRNFDRKLAR